MMCALLTTAALLTSGETESDPVSPLQDAPELPAWSGALTLGATWLDGNTESASLNAAFNAVRRGESDRWTLDASRNYGETNEASTGEETITSNNADAGVQYDYFHTEKTYLFGNGSAKIDHVAELDLRYIFGAGVGYQWTESEKVKWGTDVGLSFVDEDFEDNSADADFLALRFGSNLTYQVSETTIFEQVAELLPSLDDSEDVIARIDNRLKLTITGRWIAQIQYVLDFDGSVPSGNDETDHRIVLSVGWSVGDS